MDNKLKTENIRYFRTAAGSEDVLEVKAYEVYPNVWAIPSRYMMEPLQDLDEVTNPEQFSIYDKKYLADIQEQDEFLKSIQAAIEDIKKRTFGLELLTAVSGAVPLPKDTGATNTTLQCIDENGKHTHDVVANVVLWGPGNNLNSNRLISKSDDDSNGIGSMVELIWNPQILIKNIGTNRIKPATDELVGLLTKALFRLYGLGLNKIRYPFYQLDDKKYYSLTAEDLISYGGFSANVVNLQPYYFLEDQFTKVKEKYESAKKRIDDIKVNDEYSQMLTLKYQFDLYSLFHISTSYIVSTVIPANDKYGGLVSYYTGPNALIDSKTDEKLTSMVKIPLKKIKYSKNQSREYDEYDLTNGEDSTQYFENFTFPKSKHVFVETQPTPENVFVNLPSEEITKIILPVIPAESDLIKIPFQPATPKSITTELITTDVPTLGLIFPAVKSKQNLSDIKMTSKLSDALDSDKQTFAFDNTLVDKLSELTSVSDAELFGIIRLIKNELLSVIDNFTTFGDNWSCPRWIDYCFQQVFGSDLKNLIVQGDFEKVFNISDTLILPKQLPEDILQLKPYLFYQWYAKRYTRILRLESLFYQILNEHITLIRSLVSSNNKGQYLQGFMNDLDKIAYNAQYMLSDWTIQLGYYDFKNQVTQVIKTSSMTSEFNIDDLLYDYDTFKLTISQFGADSINNFTPSQDLKLALNDNNSPILLLGNDEIKSNGSITQTDDSLDDETSLLLSKNTSFEGNFSAKYLLSSVGVNFTFKSIENLNFSVDFMNINIAFSNNFFEITQTGQETKKYSIAKLFGWNSLVYLIKHSSVEIWDIHSNILLVSHDLTAPQNNIVKAPIKLTNLDNELILKSFEVFEQDEEANYNDIEQGFKNGIIYTAKKMPIIVGEKYALKSSILDDMGILTSDENKKYPVFSTDVEVESSLNIILESTTGDKISVDAGVNIRTINSNGEENYLGIEDNHLIFVPKEEAELFYLKKAVVEDTIDIFYVVKTLGNMFINVERISDNIYRLNFKAGILYSTMESDMLVLPAEEANTAFYIQPIGLASLEVKDSVLGEGNPWLKEDNFLDATDDYGNQIDLSDNRISVTGSVDTDKVGTYSVVYSYTGIDKTNTEKATITVKLDKSSIKTQDSTLQNGKEWVRADNLVEVIDEDGNKVDYSDDRIIQEGDVDINKAGVYDITFRYRGKFKIISSSFKVTVINDIWYDSIKNACKTYLIDYGERINDVKGITFQNILEATRGKLYGYRVVYDNPHDVINQNPPKDFHFDLIKPFDVKNPSRVHLADYSGYLRLFIISTGKINTDIKVKIYAVLENKDEIEIFDNHQNDKRHEEIAEIYKSNFDDNNYSADGKYFISVLFKNDVQAVVKDEIYGYEIFYSYFTKFRKDTAFQTDGSKRIFFHDYFNFEVPLDYKDSTFINVILKNGEKIRIYKFAGYYYY
ncbi:hypothetical protein WOSG25_110670 [Weissella oryzae SG25]|uniref:Ig-like domain-containing protein n=2 Tax=Weissella TaxID=46255 RepID=A0A069CVS9_WEIOS|nr:bacterial Ig-like domain-containing protein [Weissella oryzae]GAK31589.1 hypothetical protein WOSG25_110670 [Weissella oryzae SG25]